MKQRNSISVPSSGARCRDPGPEPVWVSGVGCQEQQELCVPRRASVL